MVPDAINEFLKHSPHTLFNPKFLVRVKQDVRHLLTENMRLRAELEKKSTKPKREVAA